MEDVNKIRSYHQLNDITVIKKTHTNHFVNDDCKFVVIFRVFRRF